VKSDYAVKSYRHYIKGIDNKRLTVGMEVKDMFLKAYGGPDHYTSNIDDSALSALMRRPNPDMGQDYFYELIGIYYSSNGESIVWCNRGIDMATGFAKTVGPILEMWPLPPQYVDIIPDPYNVWGALGYIFNISGKKFPIPKENIIHWKRPNPKFNGQTRTHMRGLSPMEPGNKKITEDVSATDASVAMHQNDGARGVIYDKADTTMTPTQETDVRAVIDRRVNHRSMKGAVAYVQGDLGLLDLSMSSVDMELEESKDNIFDRLCNLWGVSPDLFKVGTTFNNTIQARKDLITNLILPMACSFRDEFNRVVLPAFGLSEKKVTTDIDTTQIIEIQDDNAAQTSSLAAAWWLTPNQKRKAQNEEEDKDTEGMDDYWMPTTLQRMSDAVTAAENMPTDFADENTDTNVPGANSGNNKPGLPNK
jgi:phage portal protein BeeE